MNMVEVLQDNYKYMKNILDLINDNKLLEDLRESTVAQMDAIESCVPVGFNAADNQEEPLFEEISITETSKERRFNEFSHIIDRDQDMIRHEFGCYIPKHSREEDI